MNNNLLLIANLNRITQITINLTIYIFIEQVWYIWKMLVNYLCTKCIIHVCHNIQLTIFESISLNIKGFIFFKFHELLHYIQLSNFKNMLHRPWFQDILGLKGIFCFTNI